MNESIPSQRNWFPVIVTGLTILLAVGFYAKFMPEEFASFTNDGDDDRSPAVSVPLVTEDGYKNAVMSIFATYDNNLDARAAYNALIALHVPASMQQFHIDSIIALGRLFDGRAGSEEDATARFNALHAQYSWFTL